MEEIEDKVKELIEPFVDAIAEIDLGVKIVIALYENEGRYEYGDLFEKVEHNIELSEAEKDSKVSNDNIKHLVFEETMGTLKMKNIINFPFSGETISLKSDFEEKIENE